MSDGYSGDPHRSGGNKQGRWLLGMVIVAAFAGALVIYLI